SFGPSASSVETLAGLQSHLPLLRCRTDQPARLTASSGSPHGLIASAFHRVLDQPAVFIADIPAGSTCSIPKHHNRAYNETPQEETDGPQNKERQTRLKPQTVLAAKRPRKRAGGHRPSPVPGRRKPC